jgi:hypothetical protein
MEKIDQRLELFIRDWADTPERNKKAFLRLREWLISKEEVHLDFLPRHGVTYSLRASHKNQKSRPLFVMVDVIEDEVRWLSICFYGDLISDPEEKGDFVPEGLLGEDAVCFDLMEYDDSELDYIENRFDEAYKIVCDK